MKRRVLLGGYSSEVPPLPIPNREVKLTNADGTAYLGGRVGSRLFKSGLAKDPTFLLCLGDKIAVVYFARVMIAVIQVGSFATDPLEEAAVPLISTFPPLKSPPFDKGRGFLLCSGNLLFVINRWVTIVV